MSVHPADAGLPPRGSREWRDCTAETGCSFGRGHTGPCMTWRERALVAEEDRAIARAEATRLAAEVERQDRNVGVWDEEAARLRAALASSEAAREKAEAEVAAFRFYSDEFCQGDDSAEDAAHHMFDAVVRHRLRAEAAERLAQEHAARADRAEAEVARLTERMSFSKAGVMTRKVRELQARLAEAVGVLRRISIGLTGRRATKDPDANTPDWLIAERFLAAAPSPETDPAAPGSKGGA